MREYESQILAMGTLVEQKICGKEVQECYKRGRRGN